LVRQRRRANFLRRILRAHVVEQQNVALVLALASQPLVNESAVKTEERLDKVVAIVLDVEGLRHLTRHPFMASGGHVFNDSI
jgi:hypothetical protein